MNKLRYAIKLETNKAKWEDYFLQTCFSNLLQSWNYGEAKAAVEGWIVHRGIIQKDNQPIALCQWLEKKFLKLFRIIRINRGPIWINSHPDDREKFSIYNFIYKHFSVYRGNFLFIAPALDGNEKNDAFLKNIGFKKRVKIVPWKSSLINLKKTEQELRDSLRSRLRNYLKRSENADFIFEVSSQRADCVDLMVRYVQMQKEKNFTGISAEFIQSLYDVKCQDGHVLMTRIKNTNGNIIAEKFVAIHGNQSTPLVAWTSSEGAKSLAMHFLTWKTMLHLKERGAHYFDFGGYNEIHHASVSQFKKSFGGDEYCLVGEYRGFF